uniref:E3 ubiquitin-protein ligase E3D n=1 Tax=Meloidogyne enterolobii TaxID=390850 RepID=A0A6V7WCT3_MELEN|nr:unnamed protein product [Meloidogyne enterolobii]
MVVTSYIWNTFSFFLEMKPKSEFASLFISCPKYSEEVEAEPYGLIKLEEQMLELTNNLQKDSKDEQIPLSTKRMGTKFGDILLNPPTLCLISWADNQHDLLMCKVKADVDCVNLCQKSVKMLEEELSQNCNLRDYLDRVERSKTFNVVCRQCESILHTHSKNDYEFGILPCDDWLDLSPQMDYFCAFSGNECCTKHFENNKTNTKEGLLRFSGNFGSELTRHLPTESRIVLSNLFIFFQKNTLDKTTNEHVLDDSREKIILCKNCNVQLGTSLKNQPDILRLHLSTLHVYGDNKLKTSYIPTRFYSSECFLAWMILNKCEIYSSMKLLFRSLDKMPQILIWLIEPYVVLTRGVLKELPEDTENSSSNAFPTSISFPALKVIYKLFDSDSCHQDPRANGSDSSVGILDVPLGCCIQLAELLLNSSLSLPIPLRALGQFYVGFIRLKDRID